MHSKKNCLIVTFLLLVVFPFVAGLLHAQSNKPNIDRPFEAHADFTESPMAFRWMADKMWAFVPMQAVVGQFLQTFKEFPQRQKSASFNIDQVLKQLEEGVGTGK